jgi:hypothetical protein
VAYKDQDIVQKLREIAGKEHVITDEEKLLRYGKDNSFVKPLNPFCAVRPSLKEEVQKIVLMANDTGVPVFPYSSGSTMQGAHIPSKKGITIDLSRMNKIHLVDPVSRNVIIEPGVTFARLQDEVKKQGMRVMTPVGVSSEASVLGTYIEYTPLYSWPKYGPWEILTVELVLPTGESMGTGQMDVGISPYPYSWTTAYGSVNRMYFGAQGTFGIVTRAAVTVKTDYEANRVFFIGFDDLTGMAEAVRKFFLVEAAEEVFAVNAHYMSLLLEESALKKSCAPWMLVMVVRGFEEEVEYKSLDLEDTASSLGLKLENGLPGIADAGDRILDEIAYPQGVLSHNRYKGAWNPIFCYAAKAQLSRFHDIVFSLSRTHSYPVEDIGCFVLPLNRGGTFYFEPSFYRNPDDPEESRKVEKLFLELSNELISQGGFFDRPYPLWAEKVYAKASTYHKKMRDMKQMIDPKNIMNPGKLAME